MTGRQLLRRILARPLALFPGAMRRRAAQVLAASFVEGDARVGIRWLLQLQSDIDLFQNEAALRYGDGIHVKHRLTRYHDFFVERLESGDRVLDIGCGYGAVAYSMASRAGAEVTGIDLNADNIDIARARFRHPRLTFVLGDALRDVPDDSFDIVVLSNVLEHIEDRIGFLRALITRVSARRLLIRVPAFDRDWRVPLRRELGLDWRSDPTHFTEYTRESFESEMRQAKLRVDHIQMNWGEIWAEVSPAADQ